MTTTIKTERAYKVTASGPCALYADGNELPSFGYVRTPLLTRSEAWEIVKARREQNNVTVISVYRKGDMVEPIYQEVFYNGKWIAMPKSA